VENKFQDLEKIFQEEVSLYQNLVILETSKKEAILRSDAKNLESFTKKSSDYLNLVQSIEKKRMNLVLDLHPKKETQISLSDFLSSLDKNILSIFSPLSEKLKSTVNDLKEKISINENLLKSKLEIFSMSIDALKNAAEPVHSETYGESKPKLRTNIMLNLKA
jgi:hypothetical protein